MYVKLLGGVENSSSTYSFNEFCCRALIFCRVFLTIALFKKIWIHLQSLAPFLLTPTFFGVENPGKLGFFKNYYIWWTKNGRDLIDPYLESPEGVFHVFNTIICVMSCLICWRQPFDINCSKKCLPELLKTILTLYFLEL